MGGCTQYLTVMLTTLSSEKRKQREHTGVGCRFERQCRQHVRSPAEATHDMSEAFYRIERDVETRTTECVVNDVEALCARMHRDDFVKSHRGQVDRHGAIATYRVLLRWAHRAIHRRANAARNLYGHGGDTASTQHQEVLPRTQTDAIDEPLPG